jgi:hypothetical protein
MCNINLTACSVAFLVAICLHDTQRERFSFDYYRFASRDNVFGIATC